MDVLLSKTFAQLVRCQDSDGHSHTQGSPLDEPSPRAKERLAWAMSACERLQLRMTDARRAILVCLADRQAPASLARIGQDQRVRDSFDATTIYRTVILLKNLEIVRQINAGNKLRYFVLNAPDESYAFLICQGCGKITSLVLERADETPVAEAVSLGYAKVVRLVEVRGLCPRCQTKPGIATLSPKLPVRCAKDENIHARRVSQ